MRFVISIHAPQWGATSSTSSTSGSPIYFNPRTPVGCDFSSVCLATVWLRFQSTHPSGVRPMACAGSPPVSLFQSTHPSGVRLDRPQQVHRRHPISIHAPQWGATGTPGPTNWDAVSISIHAPQWGATTLFFVIKSLKFHFNPRTPVGCDCDGRRYVHRARYFNPRTPVGCDCGTTVFHRHR